MGFQLDDEQNLIVQTVRRFVERDLRVWAADADRAGAPADKLAATGAQLGFFVDAVPVTHDGLLDGAYRHATRALRGFELGRGCAAHAALLETNVEPALAVARWGSPAAQQALFSALASGGTAALAHDSRHQLAVTDAGHGAVRLAGTLPPVPALATAAYLLLVTRDVAVLVDATQLHRDPVTPSGWRAARWATAQLDGVTVPAAFVLARSSDVAPAILAWANVSLAARAAGVATSALEHARAYAAERVQFGVPIGSFESIRRLADDAETATLAARVLAHHAAVALDAGAPDAIDLASRARVHASDAVSRATIDAVQIFGGYGFVNDYPVEKLMRDARAFEVLHGDERFTRILNARA